MGKNLLPFNKSSADDPCGFRAGGGAGETKQETRKDKA